MRNNQKGFAKILLILIIIVLFGALGFFIYPKSQLKQANQIQPTINKANEILDSNKEGWKILQNKTYNYNVQFPSSWEYFDSCLYCANDTPQYEGDVVFKSPDLETNAVPVVEKGGYISINGYKPDYSADNALGQSPEKFCESDPMYRINTCDEIQVGNKTAYRATTDYYITEVAIFENNIGILKLRASYTKDSEADILEVFD